MLNTINESYIGKKVLISGSGNVAQYATELLIKKGAKVLTLSDSAGTIYDENGITTEKLEFIKDLKNNQRGRIKEYITKFPEAKYLKNQNPWSIKCDIALPCATQNELSLNDVNKLISNGVIVVGEGANMPLTKAAVDELIKNKILFSPGKASNAEGVAVSGLEMAQNSIRLSWNEKEVLEKLENIMKSIHEICVKHGKDETGFVNYVRGANIGGFIKVADAMIAQGLI